MHGLCTCSAMNVDVWCMPAVLWMYIHGLFASSFVDRDTGSVCLQCCGCRCTWSVLGVLWRLMHGLCAGSALDVDDQSVYLQYYRFRKDLLVSTSGFQRLMQILDFPMSSFVCMYFQWFLFSLALLCLLLSFYYGRCQSNCVKVHCIILQYWDYHVYFV